MTIHTFLLLQLLARSWQKIGMGISAKLFRIQNICLHDIKQIAMNNSLYFC